MADREHFAIACQRSATDVAFLCATLRDLALARSERPVKKCRISAEKMVGVRGFEPPAPASRKQCSTRLSYTPAVSGYTASEKAPQPATQWPRARQKSIASSRARFSGP